MRNIIILSFISLFIIGCSSDEKERGITIAEHVKVHEVLAQEAEKEKAQEAEEEAALAEEEAEKEVVEEAPPEEEVVEEVPEGPQPGENLFDRDNLEYGVWMGYEGAIMTNNSEMVLTGPIEYDPNNTYAINTSAYVSYYNGDTFIETVRYSDVVNELLINPYPEANSVRISIPANRSSTFKFYIK